LKQNIDDELTESSMQETNSTVVGTITSPASLTTTRPWKPALGDVTAMDII
jgi:hypothetical protein